jgi:hypothetical protein
MFCLETPEAGSGPTNFRAEPSTCELVGDFVSSYPSMSRDPIQPHSVPGRMQHVDINQKSKESVIERFEGM